jgi:hypothetical protein
LQPDHAEDIRNRDLNKKEGAPVPDVKEVEETKSR